MSDYRMVDLRKTIGRCTDECPMCKKHQGDFVGFEIFGGKMPDVLFVGEAPGRLEVDNNRPFFPEARAGEIVRHVIKQLGLKCYAIANVCCCRPVLDGKDRTPETEERDWCVPHLNKFIDLIRPKTIICLGNTPAHTLLPHSYTKGAGVTKLSRLPPLYLNGIAYAAAFHPSYIARNGGIHSGEYKDWFKRLQFLVHGPEESSTNTIPWSRRHISEIDEVVAHFSKYDDIAFDYETTMADGAWSSNSEIIGFSLVALKDNNYKSPDAVYVEWPTGYKLSQDKRRVFVDFLRKKKPWAYNAKFEMAVTWKEFGQFVPLNDSMVLCKLEFYIQSLKANARQLLGDLVDVHDWEDVVDTLKGVFDGLISLKDKTPEDRRDVLVRDYQEYLELPELKKDRYRQKISDGITHALTYCSPEEVQRVFSANRGWDAIPVRYMGEYCCCDSYYTLLLKRKYWDTHKQWYEYYISQTWLSNVMESYGMCWDDKKAEEHDRYYLQEACHCLYRMIRFMKFDKQRTEPNEKGKEVVVKNEDGTIDIVDVTEESRLLATSIYNDNEKDLEKKLEELKKLFNPWSNDPKVQARFYEVYKTETTMANVAMLHLETNLGNMNFVSVSDLTSMLVYNDLDKTVDNVVAYANNLRGRERGEVHRVVKDIENAWDFYFKRFATEILEFQYNSQVKYGGIDVDDESTWTNEFRILYYLRRFKKVTKSRSTYIHGRIGRKIVYESEVRKLTDPPNRIRPYESIPTEERQNVCKNGNRLIINTSFFENGADTLRWRAGVHAIPWGSELRELYPPRQDDCLALHYDYSQHEVLVMAAVAGEESLLRAYERGEDLHRFVAASVLKCPLEEVTDSQRRFYKGGTFSTIYGKGIEAFAMDFLKGDIDAAHEYFDNFFNTFPGIRNYIEETHGMVMDTGYVPTVFGNPILINFPQEAEKKRKGQNYRIQSSASSLAAYGLWKLYESCTKLGIQAVPIGFTHDSGDWDIYARHLFSFVKVMKLMAMDMIKNKFNIPVKIDWEIGVHQNHMMELSEVSKNGTATTYEFSCNSSTFTRIIERIRRFYDLEFEITDKKIKKDSLKELFAPKRAFSKYVGTEQEILKGKLTINMETDSEYKAAA